MLIDTNSQHERCHGRKTDYERRLARRNSNDPCLPGTTDGSIDHVVGTNAFTTSRYLRYLICLSFSLSPPPLSLELILMLKVARVLYTAVKVITIFDDERRTTSIALRDRPETTTPRSDGRNRHNLRVSHGHLCRLLLLVRRYDHVHPCSPEIFEALPRDRDRRHVNE